MALPPFTPGQVERLARVIGDSTTGGEIDRLLMDARLPPSLLSTKWRRIREACEVGQARDGQGDAVARLVKLALAPDRFVGREDHEAFRASANEVLAFASLQLENDGRLIRVKAARTLNEAAERADRLKAKLRARDVHPDVLTFCRTELVSSAVNSF